MTLSTKLSLQFTNQSYQAELTRFIVEYRRVAQVMVVKLWAEAALKKFIDPNQLGIVTFLSKRALQACAKQVVTVIYATRKSRRQLKSHSMVVPDCTRLVPCLDSRFFKLEASKGSSFNYWLRVSSLFKGSKLRFPLKSTCHFNKLQASGELRGSICISSSWVSFSFNLPDVPPATGTQVGIDVGITNVATVSERQSPVHPQGWTLADILSKLSRQKKGSKNFKATKTHRFNFINWYVNKLNLTGVGKVQLENIHDMRRGKKTDRLRSHWTYPLIFRKLESKCRELGVQVNYINQAYTSQECSACGAVHRKSRNGSTYNCVACGHTDGADANAAQVINRRVGSQPWRGAYNPSCSRN